MRTCTSNPHLLCSWTALILAGNAIALLAACASHGSSIEGHVVEVSNPEAPAGQWKRVPSGGAYVIVTWLGTVPGAHATTACLHAAIARTDERGRFEVAGWWAVPKPYPVYARYTAVLVYKPGLEIMSEAGGPDALGARTLIRSQLSVERRLERLTWLAESGCLDRETFEDRPFEDAQGVAANFYRALYDEAMALGPHPPRLNHHLATLRKRAGIPEPPEPPWKIQILRPGGPQPAAPAPAAPSDPR
jgi:hypothetical protein